MSTQDNDQRGVPWTLLLLSLAGMALLVIGLFVGIAIHRADKLAATAATAEVPASGASADAPRVGVAVSNDASVWVGDGVVKFYFVSGSAELADGAKEALAEVVMGVATGKKAVISGYRALAGNPAGHEELTWQRVQAVRDVLAALGIGSDKMELRSPGTTIAGSAEARCIEVRLE